MISNTGISLKKHERRTLGSSNVAPDDPDWCLFSCWRHTQTHTHARL